jgi:hypothetical protein
VPAPAPAPAPAPYEGTPTALPGRVQAEDFDAGLAGSAYRDSTLGNLGGQYRLTDVDVEATGDGSGYDVGWIAPGEWLKYTVNPAASGTYALQVRVASPGTGGTFHLEANGVDKTGPLTVPSSGGWQTWTTLSTAVTLAAGPQTWRIVFDAAGPSGYVGNLDYFQVTPLDQPPSTSTPPPSTEPPPPSTEPPPVSTDAPPPPGGEANDYFNALVARGDHWKSYSLRNDAQLRQYAIVPQGPWSIAYDPAHDAAVAVIPTVSAGQPVPGGVNSMPNQVRLPMGTEDGHSYLITWDVWYGKDLSYSRNNAGSASVSGLKAFQFDSPRSPGGRPAIWFEIDAQLDRVPAEMGAVRARYYATTTTPSGPNVTDGSVPELMPLHGPYIEPNFVVQADTWTRYWVRIEQRANDYELVSLWAADETHDATLILDRCQFTVVDGVQKFWIELNTSTEGLFDTATKTMIPIGGVATPTVRPSQRIFLRNVVMLRDTPDVTQLMQRPMP